MSQVDAYTIPESPLTMAQLASRLEALFDAEVSKQRGSTAPTNPVVGMLWWDTAITPIERLRVYRAAGWRTLLTLNVDTGELTWGSTVEIAQGGTGATTAADARDALGIGSIATQAANTVSITGGSISGITDLAIADGGTGASTAADARDALGLETDSLTLTANSNQLNSGTFYLYRVGKMVVCNWTQIQHDTTSIPNSAAGFLPSEWRPVADTRNAFNNDARQSHININTNGTIGFLHRKASDGTLDGGAFSTSQGSATWILP